MLTNGVASAESGGKAPALHAAHGAAAQIVDGSGNLLRQGDMALLEFAGGKVSYSENKLLPACHDMTMEFLALRRRDQ